MSVKKFEVLKGGKPYPRGKQSKPAQGKAKDGEKYPVELPGKNNVAEISPIVDVVETETFPKKV